MNGYPSCDPIMQNPHPSIGKISNIFTMDGYDGHFSGKLHRSIAITIHLRLPQSTNILFEHHIDSCWYFAVMHIPAMSHQLVWCLAKYIGEHTSHVWIRSYVLTCNLKKGPPIRFPTCPRHEETWKDTFGDDVPCNLQWRRNNASTNILYWYNVTWL